VRGEWVERWMGCYPYERTFGRGGGGEMCREGTREIAEGEGTCSVACRTGMGSNL